MVELKISFLIPHFVCVLITCTKLGEILNAEYGT